jgi:hypothetical protein
MGLLPSRVHAAVGEESFVRFAPQRGALALAQTGGAAPLLVDAADWPGVVRATRDLQADVERVSGQKPAVVLVAPPAAPVAILIGTLGRSQLIDDLVKRGKLDARAVAGKWESWIRQVVDQPLPGVDRALVIAGSDKRGTIYGIYDLSENIGVSPWYWWADVTPAHHDTLFALPGRAVHGEPSVKYRGIFLNDEAPDLTNWIRGKFGDAPVSESPPVPPGIANYGHAFYEKLFEVILRLRGNYLWPAMWNNAFNEDDPANARLADDYGIVMGNSHQEPMLRAQKEWDRRFLRTLGTWNYAKHPDVMENFWRDGIRRNKNFESIVTIGLRGANDTEMAPGGPAANRALLEQIVGVQRKILAAEVNPDVTKVPQLWCLYKEVQDFYESGMRAPDDVTLLWAEDNWGNVRRLPTPEERQRAGGAGIYYHFDYHGGPRSYQWLNTSPLPKIWEQMSLAKQYGADRIWIVNVGHFKGYEVPTEFFLNFAWDTTRWTGANVPDFTRLWAAREFGPEHATEIGDIVARYAKYNGRRKPELLAPDTFSLVAYHEAETVVADWQDLATRAENLSSALPAAARAAFDELVLFPTQASALVNDLYLAAGKNALYAKQGRASANDWAAKVQADFEAYLAMVAHFDHDLAGGKWEHFMDQPVLGYRSWRDPPKNSLDHLKLVEVAAPDTAALGVAVESGTGVSPVNPADTDHGRDARATLSLPRFDSLNRQRAWVDVFKKGQTAFDFTATASAPWIALSKTQGSTATDQQLWVSVDWTRAPKGTATGSVTIAGAGSEVIVKLEALNPSDLTRDSLQGFVENQGAIAIEPEHFTQKVDAGPNHWSRIADYGRTLSGMRAEAPVDAPPAEPGKNSPCLEYRLYVFNAGKADVTAITAPTLNFIPDRAVRYAASFDDEPPQVVTLVPAGYKAQNGNRAWEKSVGDNAHHAISHHLLATPGYHTLKLWMIDPAVVLQKIVVDLGGVKPGYLGPPESFHATATR